MPQINYEYLSKLKPINGNSEGFDNPLSRASTDARTIKSLGFSGSNSGNVSDFDNPDSELSRGTASILQNMRLQREARKSSQSMPESEKLFLVEMRRRKAKEDAKNYMDMRKVEQKDELINLKKMELQQTMAETLADREEKERTKAQEATKSFNDGYATFLEKTGSADSPEARQAYAKQREFTIPESMALPQQQETQQETAIQSQVQDGSGVAPKTVSDQQKPKTIKEFIYGKKKGEDHGSITPDQIVDDWITGKSPVQLSDWDKKLRPEINSAIRRKKESLYKSGDEKDKVKATFDGQKLGDTESSALGKSIRVVDQLEEIKNAFKQEAVDEKGQILGIDMSPIIGRLRGWNPYDKSAKEINSMLQAVVPNMARGIYGEVGVLTDNDIKNYKQVLPRLSDPNDIKDALIGISINQARNAILSNLKNLRMQGKNVSGYVELLEDLEARESNIRAGLEAKVNQGQGQTQGQTTQQNNNGSGITREQAIAELKRRGRI